MSRADRTARPSLIERAFDLGRLGYREIECTIVLSNRSFDLASMESLRAGMSSGLATREEFTRSFAYAIPCREAVEAIRRHAPEGRVLDPMAGSGYWAKVLAAEGLSVIASDNFSWTRGWSTMHFEVAELDAAEAIEAHHDRLVLLSWPPYESDAGARALEALAQGQVVAVIGEGPGGCTGDDRFFELLDGRFEPLEEVPLPQFYGLRDSMSVYRKARDR